MKKLREKLEKPITWKEYFKCSAVMNIMGIFITTAAYMAMFCQCEILRFITRCIREAMRKH